MLAKHESYTGLSRFAKLSRTPVWRNLPIRLLSFAHMLMLYTSLGYNRHVVSIRPMSSGAFFPVHNDGANEAPSGAVASPRRDTCLDLFLRFVDIPTGFNDNHLPLVVWMWIGTRGWKAIFLANRWYMSLRLLWCNTCGTNIHSEYRRFWFRFPNSERFANDSECLQYNCHCWICKRSIVGRGLPARRQPISCHCRTCCCNACLRALAEHLWG
jgi:hypothetical protein